MTMSRKNYLPQMKQKVRISNSVSCTGPLEDTGLSAQSSVTFWSGQTISVTVASMQL